MSVTVSTAVAAQNVLGEGAFWDAPRQRFWWVDMLMPAKLQMFEPASGRVETYDMPQMVMGVRARRDGTGLIVATHSGVCQFDYATATLTHLLDPEPERPYNRCNDVGTDAKGRFWFGTMQNNVAPDGSPLEIVSGAGSLFRLDPDMTLTAHERGIWVANTVCWSPDNRTMYFADTPSGEISAYDYDLEAGRISKRRPFARFDRGAPDGSTVVADGCLWNARWDGGIVVRFTPRGEVDLVVEVPVARPTSCAFGGPDLGDLYITTARYGVTPAQLAEAPLSGNLLVCRPGAKGLPAPEFG